ncbi:MAG: class I SAM-dependent RNA methyltransferase, partial [Pseudomonadota bacterium]
LGSRKGTLKFAVTATETGLDLAITGAKAPDPQTRMALGQVPVARLTVDGDPIAHHNPPTIHIDGIPVTPPPGAFLQATEHGEGALLAAVKDIIGDATSAVDLFAGCGTFALPLAKGAEVHAVEGQAELTDAMTTAWRGAQLKRMTTETRDLFRRPLVQSELKYAAAVIDPPRAGAEAQVAEFAGSQIPRIAMVSCNPVTFARDAKALIHAGFTLNWIEVVDQFRWSPHIELVGSFTR